MKNQLNSHFFLWKLLKYFSWNFEILFEIMRVCRKMTRLVNGEESSHWYGRITTCKASLTHSSSYNFSNSYFNFLASSRALMADWASPSNCLSSSSLSSESSFVTFFWVIEFTFFLENDDMDCSSWSSVDYSCCCSSDFSSEVVSNDDLSSSVFSEELSSD